MIALLFTVAKIYMRLVGQPYAQLLEVFYADLWKITVEASHSCLRKVMSRPCLGATKA